MATPPDPRAVLERTAPPAARTVAYGSDPAQVYDVRLPTGRPRDVTVVVVHGGFWQPEFDRAHAAAQSQAFADDGFTVAVLEYRRAGMDGGGWPGTFDDITAALAAVRADPTLPDRWCSSATRPGGTSRCGPPASPGRTASPGPSRSPAAST